MKKRLPALFLLVFLIPFHCHAASSRPQAITLVCEDRENFPFLMGEGPDILERNPGLSVEALRLVAGRVGVSVSFMRLPWNRCKNALRYGAADGLFSTGYTPEDRSMGVFPMKAGAPDQNRRMAMIPLSIYTLKSSGLTWDGGYFNRQTFHVGVSMGYCVAADLRRVGLFVDESPGITACFRKLVHNRVDAVVAPQATGDHIIGGRDPGFREVVRLDKPWSVQPFYLIFSHQFYSVNRDLAELFWDSLAEMRGTAAMKALENKYAGF